MQKAAWGPPDLGPGAQAGSEHLAHTRATAGEPCPREWAQVTRLLPTTAQTLIQAIWEVCEIFQHLLSQTCSFLIALKATPPGIHRPSSYPHPGNIQNLSPLAASPTAPGPSPEPPLSIRTPPPQTTVPLPRDTQAHPPLQRPELPSLQVSARAPPVRPPLHSHLSPGPCLVLLASWEPRWIQGTGQGFWAAFSQSPRWGARETWAPVNNPTPPAEASPPLSCGFLASGTRNPSLSPVQSLSSTVRLRCPDSGPSTSPRPPLPQSPQNQAPGIGFPSLHLPPSLPSCVAEAAHGHF